MAKAKYYEVMRPPQHNRALDQLNQAIALQSWFTPALLEKAQVLIGMGDWEQALETTQRVLTQDESNLEALRLAALCSITRHANTQQTLDRLKKLSRAMDRSEGKNA